jgi:hypothetical protein
MTTFMNTIRRVAIVMTMTVMMAGVSTAVWAEVYLYADTWNADDVDDNGNIQIFAWGAADSDDRPFTLTHHLKDPNQNVLAWGNQSGWGYRESTRSAWLIAGSAPHGTYNNIVQADQGSEHYGCFSYSLGLYELFGDPYHATPPPPASATEHGYDRCLSGVCQDVTVKKRHFTTAVSQLPQHAWVSVWVFDYGFGQICKPYGAVAKTLPC